MTTNEIKKALYKQKPKAELLRVTKNGLFYITNIEDYIKNIEFLIPFEDLGEATFHATEESQLLIRWII